MIRALLSTTCIALAVLVASPTSVAAQGDDVLLIVNGDEISAWEIKLRLPVVQGEMARQGLEVKGQEVITRTLNRAVDNLLLAQEARRRGITPNEERVNEKMKVVADEAGGRAELEAELIKSFITYDQLRSTVVQADLIQSMVETEITPGIEIPDEHVVAYYEEHPDLFRGPDKIHSRHILFLVDSGDTDAQREAARQRAEIARARALAGEDFATLAVELSEGPNAAKGGDLGFTARGQMVEAFDEAVWALEPGQISEVVESRMGYHVIKAEEIIAGPVVSIDEARPSVTELLRQERLIGTLASIVAELRQNAEIRDPSE